MKLIIASDHAGFAYKEMLIAYLDHRGDEVTDGGAFSAEASDYPDWVIPAAERVVAGEFERGIVLGGSGNGEAIAANKVCGIRCALCWSTQTAEMARRHNNANVLSIGERVIAEDTVRNIVHTFLTTPFDGDRHAIRIAKIADYEQK